MTTRWIAAAAAAVGVGVLAAPMLMHEDPLLADLPQLAVSHERGAACKSDRKMNFDFTLQDVNGAKIRLADYKGKAILLNYWATWCGPCRLEIPIFNELYAQYKDRGVAIIGVTVDDEPPAVKEFIKTLPMNYPVLIGHGQEEVLDAAGTVSAYPMSFFIDRSGTVCGRHIGTASREEFEAALKALL